MRRGRRPCLGWLSGFLGQRVVSRRGFRSVFPFLRAVTIIVGAATSVAGMLPPDPSLRVRWDLCFTL